MYKLFEDEKLYTPSEISKILGISNEAVYKWIRSKKVVAIKVGKLWRIKGKELNEKIIKMNF